MKLLDTAGKTLKKAAAAVADAVTPSARRPRDPWYSDAERRAEIDARTDRSWLGPRRRGWLR